LTTAANAVLLQYSSVVYVAVLAPFLLREKTRGRDWLLILMTLGGLSLLILSSGHGGRGPSEALGILAGAGCGLCWGMCVIFMRRKGSESIPLSCLVIGNAITVIYSFPAMMDIPLISLPRNLALAAVLGIGPLGLGYVFYLSAIGKVTAMEASLIPAIEPLLNPIWAYLVLTETPSPWTVAGGVVVLMAVGLKAASALRAPPLTQASSS
jgi:drug/metabolite transporter (DMT)-like permease